MKPPKKHPKNDDKLAAQWLATPRTIRNWRAAGAPLHNRERMRLWLTSRRTLPAATAELLLAQSPKLPTAVADAPAESMVQGAAAALKRLEGAETQSYTAFTEAVRCGDPATVKLARENWLRILEQLRKLDLQVDLAGRELIPRVEVKRDAEKVMAAFQTAMGKSFEMSLPSTLRGLDAPQIALELAQVQARFWEIFGEGLASLSDATPDTTAPKANG